MMRSSDGTCRLDYNSIRAIALSVFSLFKIHSFRINKIMHFFHQIIVALHSINH
jgi:hypothetical protein